METLLEPTPVSLGGTGTPLLQLEGISKRFVQDIDLAGRIANLLGAENRASVVHAVADVDLEIRPGEVIGVVGESGCGKSTLGRVIAGINPPTEGTVSYLGRPIADMNATERRAWGLGVQMIFQNPMASLNPRMRVMDIVGEAPVVHGLVKAKDKAAYVGALMRQVGLPAAFASRHPAELSGGQRQRVAIARALALEPEILVLDEPVSALDVSIQAQVLNLMKDLKSELGLTYLFISHNLAVVNYMADRVAVMYAGRIVEIGPCETIMRAPVHPYTKKLLAAVPLPSLDHKLDFETIGTPTASAMKIWGKQFLDEKDSDQLTHVDLGGGHLVLARTNVDARELVAG